jgi:hypothetical protein
MIALFKYLANKIMYYMARWVINARKFEVTRRTTTDSEKGGANATLSWGWGDIEMRTSFSSGHLFRAILLPCIMPYKRNNARHMSYYINPLHIQEIR